MAPEILTEEVPMAYQCPRCGGPVQRGASAAAGLAGGAVGALLYAAFGSFQCKSCGPIPRSEFPPEVQTKMTLGALALIGIAVVLLVVVIVLLILLRPT
jgi:hypothetical protein